MFDFEAAVAKWRGQMAGGVKEPEFLDELEEHLRDDVERRMRDGLTAEQAFLRATAQMGGPAEVEQEFRKVRRRTLWQVLSMRIWTPRVSYFSVRQVRGALMTVAGVPHAGSGAGPGSGFSPPLEPGWASYLRAALMTLPAALAWLAAKLIVAPKLNEIWLKAGEEMAMLIRRVFDAMYLLGTYWWVILGVMALLEWRAPAWPRYRRATLGAGAFLANLGVMTSVLFMVILALVAASKIMAVAK